MNVLVEVENAPLKMVDTCRRRKKRMYACFDHCRTTWERGEREKKIQSFVVFST